MGLLIVFDPYSRCLNKIALTPYNSETPYSFLICFTFVNDVAPFTDFLQMKIFSLCMLIHFELKGCNRGSTKPISVFIKFLSGYEALR